MDHKVLDAHVHIWDFDKAEYAWLKNDTSILNRPYHIEELEAERVRAGVTDGILVQAANNTQDTHWMLEVAEKTPWIKGVVGWVPLMEPELTAALLKEHLHHPYFKGVRHLIHDEPDPQWLLQPTVLESLSILAAHAVPYDIVGVTTQHLQVALQVGEKIPSLRLMLDHMNQPPMDAGESFGEWGRLIKAMAAHANIFVKISGLGTAAKKGTAWTAADIQPSIQFVLEHFGHDRCCCGGDWPVSLLAGEYAYTWQQYKTVLSSLLNEEGLKKVLFDNGAKFYKLNEKGNEATRQKGNE